jgi:PAS domain S-box-containing protein
MTRPGTALGSNQESADTLRAIVESSPQAVIAVAPDRTVRLWNRAAEQIFGYTAGEVVGRDYPLVPPEGEAEFWALFRRACGGEVQRHVRVRRQRKDGRIVDIRFSGAPFYDADGNLGGVVYSLEDITDQLVAEAMLRQAQKMEAIGTLTGGMAHDFNNLLGIIIGNLDLLQELVGPNEAARERATIAINAALRGAELTRQLLAFSRRQPLQPRRLDVNALIANMTKLLARTLGEHVTIQFIPSADLWPVVADAAQLESALINLAVNARDAMPNGGTLTIHTRNAHIDDDYAAIQSEVTPGCYSAIEVSDTGIGMPPEIAARVFEPFFTTKAENKGTGLGLSMVFGFMKQSGGHVSVYSEVGRGTTLRLYLPRAMEGDIEERPDQELPEMLATHNETILVVDDNTEMRRVVVKQLAALGYRTIEAANGPGALTIIERGEPIDLLFTDIVMPGGMSGIQLAAAARQRRPGLKVLFTSGFPVEAAQKSTTLPPSEYMISKPYRKEDLARQIRRVINGTST